MADFVGTSGDDVQNGTSGSDNFDFSQGGNDTLRGKGGDDVFTMGGTFTADDQIDGGGGDDHLILDGDTSVILTATTLVNVERIETTSGHNYSLTTDDANVGAGGLLLIFPGGEFTFDGSAETDGAFRVIASLSNEALNIAGGAGDDIIDTGHAADILTGGAGDDELDAGNDSAVDQLFGGDGADTLVFDVHDEVFGGDGDDHATLSSFSFDVLGQLDGGAGTDTLSLSDGAQIGPLEFSATATAFEVLLISNARLHGGGEANIIDLSGFSGLAADQTVKIYGGGGGDTLTGNVERDIMHGGGGNNALFGMAGDDNLLGGNKDDTLTGGAGADHLNAKGGDDTYAYGGASDSTGFQRDTIVRFDAQHNSFAIPSAVNAVDAAIASGALSRSSFNADLAAAADDEHLGAHDAVVFTPDAGGFSGATFLIVDLNGDAGYQAGEDIVVQLKNATHLDDLAAGNFI